MLKKKLSVPIIIEDNEENKCHMCGNTFSTKSNLGRHLKKCNNPQNMQQLLRLVTEMKQEIKELRQNQQPSVVNNTIQIDNSKNIYVNLNICHFGKEDLTKLNPDTVMKILKGQTENFMPEMIEYVHANLNFPEHHNIFYDPELGKVLIFEKISDSEMSWQEHDFNEISHILTEKFKNHVRPGNGPYFDLAMKEKDYDTSNKIILISRHLDLETDEILNKTKESLTKVTKNKGFKELVGLNLKWKHAE